MIGAQVVERGDISSFVSGSTFSEMNRPFPLPFRTKVAEDEGAAVAVDLGDAVELPGNREAESADTDRI